MARLVKIQILHFTGDKVKTPAVKPVVSPLRYVSLYDCIDNNRISAELSKNLFLFLIEVFIKSNVLCVVWLRSMANSYRRFGGD